jgi:hypothetical protein
MSKYRATRTAGTGNCAGIVSGDPDGDIFKPTGDTENGESVYAKDGTGPPYLIYGTITFGQSDLCLCVENDVTFERQTFIRNGVDSSGCVIWRLARGAPDYPRISAYGIEQPENPCYAVPWYISTQPAEFIFSNGPSSDGDPYLGHYGDAGSGYTVSAIGAGSRTGWFISDYPTIAELQSRVDSLPLCDQIHEVLYGPILPGTFTYECFCNFDVIPACEYDLDEYHYPNPSCIKVKAADSGGTPTYDYEGDYAFTGDYFPADDDQDYGTFTDGTLYVWRDVEESRWYMGDAVDGTADYQSLVTDKRTPPRGPWKGVAEETEGKYKTLPSCVGKLWFPWCCRPCWTEPTVDESCSQVCAIYKVTETYREFIAQPSLVLGTLELSLSGGGVNSSYSPAPTNGFCDGTGGTLLLSAAGVSPALALLTDVQGCGGASASRIGSMFFSYGSYVGCDLYLAASITPVFTNLTSTGVDLQYVLLLGLEYRRQSDQVVLLHYYDVFKSSQQTLEFPKFGVEFQDYTGTYPLVKVRSRDPGTREFTSVDIGKRFTIPHCPPGGVSYMWACLSLTGGPDVDGWMDGVLYINSTPPFGWGGVSWNVTCDDSEHPGVYEVVLDQERQWRECPDLVAPFSAVNGQAGRLEIPFTFDHRENYTANDWPCLPPVLDAVFIQSTLKFSCCETEMQS